MSLRGMRRRVVFAAAGLMAVAVGCAQQPAVDGQQRQGSAVDLSRLLQARLDRAGGRIFLRRLSGGRCYSTRGLWVSRSGTSITSNGACIVVVGPGPVRLRSADGDPIAASAAFFISRRSPAARPPHDVTIRGLRIIVGAGNDDGIDVYADRVRIEHVQIEGSPFDDVYIGGRTNVSDYSRHVILADSRLDRAARNAVSVTAAIDVRITGNVIAGAGLTMGIAADPGDGIDVEPNAPTNPIARLLIARNLIVDNVGSGIALALHPHAGLPREADRITIVGNSIVGNSAWRRQGAISVSGGQADGRGHALILGNTFSANGGPTLSRTGALAMRLTVRDNANGHHG